MKSRSNENQHFVPQFYFRQFSLAKKSICMLIKSNGQIVEHASIKKQSSKKKFYGDKDVEKHVTTYDTRHSVIHRLILRDCSMDNFTSCQVNTLLENIMFQHERTKKAREKVSPLIDHLNNFVFSQLEEGQDDWPEEANEALKNSLLNVMSSVKPHQIWQIQSMEESAKNASKIKDLKILILINKTNSPFIFSDSPVIFSNPFLKEFKGSSIQSPNLLGVLILYPLSSNVAVMLYDGEIYDVTVGQSDTVFEVINEIDIDSINRCQLHEADEFVYFGDFKFNEYLYRLWGEERETFSKNEAVMSHNIPSINLNGDISHYCSSLEPSDPSFFPYLSFLSIRDRYFSRSLPYELYCDFAERINSEDICEYLKVFSELRTFPFRPAQVSFKSSRS